MIRRSLFLACKMLAWTERLPESFWLLVLHVLIELPMAVAAVSIGGLSAWAHLAIWLGFLLALLRVAWAASQRDR